MKALKRIFTLPQRQYLSWRRSNQLHRLLAPYLESEDTLVSGWKDYTLQAWVYKETICKTWSA